MSSIALAEPAKTDDDDPNVNNHGIGVNRILNVLRSAPDMASESCLHALGQMHKVQKQLSEVENHDEDPDVSLVRDVLASDMEDVMLMCGADAHRLCREREEKDSNLAKLCSALPDSSNDQE